MPDDLKINVVAAGARAAQADLQAVAAAEKQVTGEAAAGAEKTAKGKKQAADAADLLGGKQRNLMQSIRMLGPEFAVVADTIQTFTRATSTAALASGLLGAAIFAAMAIYRRFEQAAADAKRQAEALTQALTKQAQAYLTLLEAAAKGKAPAPAEAAAQALALAEQYGLGAEATKELAGMIGRRGPAAAESAARRLARARGVLTPEMATEYAIQRAGLAMAPMTAEANLQRVAELESVRQRRAISAEDMRIYLVRLALRARAGDEGAARELEEARGAYGGALGGSRFSGGVHYHTSDVEQAGARRLSQAP